MPAVREKKEFFFSRNLKSSAKAQDIGEYLEKLAKGNLQKLTPRQIVEDARQNPEAPTNACFTWDNKTAGDKCRLIEARRLLNTLQYRIVSMGDSKPRKMYVNLIVETKQGAERVYMPQQIAARVPELREQLYEQAIAFLRSFRTRFREVSEMSGVHEAIDEVMSRIEKKEAA